MHKVFRDDICCSGDCTQGRNCPRYPVDNGPSAAAAWIGVLTVGMLVFMGLVWAGFTIAGAAPIS